MDSPLAKTRPGMRNELRQNAFKRRSDAGLPVGVLFCGCCGSVVATYVPAPRDGSSRVALTQQQAVSHDGCITRDLECRCERSSGRKFESRLQSPLDDGRAELMMECAQALARSPRRKRDRQLEKWFHKLRGSGPFCGPVACLY